MSTITIRNMRDSDLNAVSALAMLANPFATKEKYHEHLLDELRRNPDLSFVAVENGEVVAYTQADVHDDQATLEDIAVAVEHQGKGVGKRLLDRTLTVLRQKGAKTLLAEVHYKCAPAIPFYYRHGFRISGFKHDRFGKGHDAIILKLLLQ